MTTYPTTTPFKPTGAERVPKGTFGYFRARNRHRLYSLIIKEFKKSGLTQAELARRLGKKPEIVCRLLATPGNLQADTFSDLLFAISGAQPAYGLSYPLDQSARNDTRPKWLDQPSPDEKFVDTPAPKTKREASSAIEANDRNFKSRLVDQDAAPQLGKVPQSAAHRHEPIRSLPQNPLDVQGVRG